MEAKKPLRHWAVESKDPAYVSAMREACLESFKIYCISVFEFVYRKRFIWNEHHDVMSHAFMRMWIGDPEYRNLLINLPPRYGKTEMFCLFVTWTYAHNPMCENMHLSYADILVRRNSSKIKLIMKSLFFQSLFDARIDPKKDAVDEWRTLQGGLFFAASTGGQVTGSGAGAIDETEEYDLKAFSDSISCGTAGSLSDVDDLGNYRFGGMIWIDDPLKPKDANTIRREQVNELWDETIKSRRNSVTTPVACCMQRIHEGDFSAELRSDTAEQFKHISMRALREDGTALWPFKHTVKKLIEMKDRRVYVFNAQYQQEPSPKGGSVFLAEWWKYVLAEPDDFERVVIISDTASKIKERNDYSVFQCWGKYLGRIFLLDQVRGKWESPELKRVAVEFIKQCYKRYPQLSVMYAEDKASGTGLIQSLPALTTIPVMGIQRNIDKGTRADDAAPHVQSGQVVLIQGKACNGIFVAEVTSFNKEMTHLFDDQVDCLMDAIDILLDKNQGDIVFYDYLQDCVD